jgi:hypothetical protein
MSIYIFWENICTKVLSCLHIKWLLLLNKFNVYQVLKNYSAARSKGKR